MARPKREDPYIDVVVRGLKETRHLGVSKNQLSSMVGYFAQTHGWSERTLWRRLDELDPAIDIKTIFF